MGGGTTMGYKNGIKKVFLREPVIPKLISLYFRLSLRVEYLNAILFIHVSDSSEVEEFGFCSA